MNLNEIFKALIDADNTSIVICDMNHTIIYMNPVAVEKHLKKGGANLIGSSIMDCHNKKSCEKIEEVISWFKKSSDNNRIFTFHNPKENKDVYMIALRDSQNNLMGYYEKHEYRTPDNNEFYCYE